MDGRNLRNAGSEVLRLGFLCGCVTSHHWAQAESESEEDRRRLRFDSLTEEHGMKNPSHAASRQQGEHTTPAPQLSSAHGQVACPRKEADQVQESSCQEVAAWFAHIHMAEARFCACKPSNLRGGAETSSGSIKTCSQHLEVTFPCCGRGCQ